MATYASSDSLPSSSRSTSCSPLDNLKGLDATIFGINRLSIGDRPRNVLKCLEVDRSGHSGSGQLYRQLYLCDGLCKADQMYTTDVIGHHGCVNTLSFSNQDEQFLVSGESSIKV